MCFRVSSLIRFPWSLNHFSVLYGFNYSIIIGFLVLEFMKGCDMLVSDAFALNMMYLKRAGYSVERVIVYQHITGIFNLVGTSSNVTGMCAGAVRDPIPFDHKHCCHCKPSKALRKLVSMIVQQLT